MSIQATTSQTPITIIRDRVSIQNTQNTKLFKYVKIVNPIVKEEIVYKSNADDFLKGKYPNLLIVNRLNVLTNSCRTVAKYTNMNKQIELTSDEVARVIGQNNYNSLFSALCCVISQEIKIKGILSLLTPPTKIWRGNSRQIYSDSPKTLINTHVQTDESRIVPLLTKKKRVKRRLTPYVVKDSPLKKVVIHPSNINKSTALAAEKNKAVNGQSEETSSKIFINEDSNISNISFGNISLSSSVIAEGLENAMFLDNIDKHINPFSKVPLKLLDGGEIMLEMKPEDDFHIATVENLKNLSIYDKKRLLCHQAYVDWKLCLQRNIDGNLPLHLAVLNNDDDLVRRQCIMLKKRQESVDISAKDNATALQMAIFNESPQCTAVLLEHGADLFSTDEDDANAFHLAAAARSEQVAALLHHCMTRARRIIKENEDMFQIDVNEKSDEELAKILLEKISKIYDSQGYTPLMIASKLGAYENAELLAKACPDTVNEAMPNSGNTALYIAVAAACIETNRGTNRSKVPEKYLNTIGRLIDAGADPALENHSGSSVNTLLTEFSISELSSVIANKLTSVRYADNSLLGKSFDSYMLVKENDKVELKDIKWRPCEVSEVKRESDKKITQNPIKTDKLTVIQANDKIVTQNPIKFDSILTVKPNTGDKMITQSPIKTDKLTVIQANDKIVTQNPIKFDSILTVKPNTGDKMITQSPVKIDSILNVTPKTKEITQNTIQTEKTPKTSDKKTTEYTETISSQEESNEIATNTKNKVPSEETITYTSSEGKTILRYKKKPNILKNAPQKLLAVSAKRDMVILRNIVSKPVSNSKGNILKIVPFTNVKRPTNSDIEASTSKIAKLQ